MHADEPAARLAKLQALLSATAPPMEDVALIAELHSLPSADLAPPLDVTPQRKKEKTFEALLRQVEGLARQQPVLMIFDDLHWIDPSSRELLDRVIERVADWPVLLLAMFRPEFQPPWTGQPHVTMMTLPGSTGATRPRWSQMSPDNAALPPEIVEEIAERTDGVPLFVEELTKAVLEAGSQGARGTVLGAASGVVGAGDLACLADGAAGPAGTGRQGGCTNRRGDRPRVRLRASGVHHRSAGAATSRGARSADERRPVVRPRHAARVHLHLQTRAGAGCRLRHIAAQPAPAFARPYCHDPRRPLSGDRVAQPALLAQHCEAAGLAEKAVAYRLKAGQQALARSAMAEAVAQLRKGLAALAGLPDGQWHQQQELDLQTALVSALTATAGWSGAEVGETLGRARALAEQLDRPECLVPLIMGQFGFHHARSEHRQALALGEQLEQIGEARNDAAAQLLGRVMHGSTRFWLGEFIAARAVLERCVDPSDSPHRAVERLSLDPYTTGLIYLAITLACLGYVDQARSRTGRSGVGGPPARTRPQSSYYPPFGGLDRLAHPLAYGALGGMSDSIDRARFSVLFGLGTGIPRRIVTRAWASTGRPCATHTGASGTGCCWRRSKYGVAVYVAR